MLNQVTMQGRLCSDPELRRTKEGVSVVTVRIACDRDYKGPDGSRDTDFVDVVLWRATAEYVTKYAHKGDMVIVAGRLQPRQWTDKDGGRHTAVEIQGTQCYLVGTARRSAADGGNQGPQGNGNTAYSAAYGSGGYGGSGGEDADLPF